MIITFNITKRQLRINLFLSCIFTGFFATGAESNLSKFPKTTEIQFQKAIEVLKNNRKGEISKSVNILNNLASIGHGPSQHILGDLYLNGNGVKRDLGKGAQLILSAAKAHIPEAQNNMGWLLATGTGIEKNPKKAIEWYTKAAQTNYAPAQFNLAEALIGGLAGSPDIIEATHWYRKAATLGHVDSEYALGKLYAHNQPEESIKWMRRAANNGHSRAQHQTATMYLKGIGVTINAKIAYDYFNLAANQNHPKSVLEIGLMLYEGYGIERNQEKGIEMVKRAINLGDKHASQKLRSLSINKFDFLLNLNLAAKGDAVSMINLGWNYLKGKQLTKDKAESYAWFNLAAITSGNQKHVWARDYVAEKLSIDELVEAKKRAKQIKLIYGTKQSND